MTCHTLLVLCNHRRELVSEHFHHPERKPHAHCAVTPHPASSPSLETTSLHSLSVVWLVLEVSWSQAAIANHIPISPLLPPAPPWLVSSEPPLRRGTSPTSQSFPVARDMDDLRNHQPGEMGELPQGDKTQLGVSV